MIRRLILQPIQDIGGSLEQLATAKHPFGALALTFLALVVTWFVYVPIHELLHVLGCVATGGAVSQLDIQPQYGGVILSKYFDFVVSGGDYAGRLSGFDTHGSDLTYLATDFMPFALSVLIGIPLLKSCVTKRRPIRLGIATVVGVAPLYNIFGDYYEMGSIITTRVVTFASRAKSVAFQGLRSDDVFALAGDLITDPAKLHLSGAGTIAAAAFLSLTAFVLGIFLAFLTYGAGHLLWKPLFPGMQRSVTHPATN